MSEFTGQQPQAPLPKPLIMQAPIPAPEKYYQLSIDGASMHRSDGALLPFKFRFLATSNLVDQQYLDHEIAMGHPNLSYADDMQIEAYKLRSQTPEDIRAAIKAELQAELQLDKTPVLTENEQEIKARLQAEIMDELARTGQLATSPTAASLTPAVPKLGGIVGSDKIPAGAAGVSNTAATPTSSS